jgi:hypothetical protein
LPPQQRDIYEELRLHAHIFNFTSSTSALPQDAQHMSAAATASFSVLMVK